MRITRPGARLHRLAVRFSVAASAVSIVAVAASAAGASQSVNWSLVDRAGLTTSEAGRSVLVGVVDTGIAVDDNTLTHPCFRSGDGATETGERRFTNSKVVVARGYTTTGDPRSAKPLNMHGSHVASIIACNADTPLWLGPAGKQVRYGTLSGVAPAALLASYNPFDKDGYSEDAAIAKAVDDAVADGVRILNLSLGWPGYGGGGPTVDAVRRAMAAGVLVVAAAGNEGPDRYSVTQPGDVEGVISVGAVSSGVELQTVVRAGGQEFSSMVADIGLVTKDFSAPAAAVRAPKGSTAAFGQACKKTAVPAAVKKKIAVVARGTCTFTEKFNNVAARGAVGIIVVDLGADVAGFAMGGDGPTKAIPGALVGRLAVPALKAQIKSKRAVTITAMHLASVTAGRVAEFSSAGPAFLVAKPDVVAPGHNVAGASHDARCGQRGCFEVISGTSMATPVVSGAAALLWGRHPQWSMAMLRSALVHTADPDLLDWKGRAAGADRRGVGLLDIAAADSARIGFSTLSSTLMPYDTTKTVTLLNPGTDAVRVTFSTTSELFAVDGPAELEVPAAQDGVAGEAVVSIRAVAPLDGVASTEFLTATVTAVDGTVSSYRYAVRLIDAFALLDDMQRVDTNRHRPKISAARRS